MVGRDGFLSIAHRTNQFAGIETSAGIREVPQLENGQWVIKQQLVAESTVWRKDSDKPVTVQVSYNEYCQRTAEGTPTRFWLEKPETMLKKVAESQALRKAFNIHGVYSPEELGAGFELTNGEIVTSAIDADCRRIETDKAHLSIVKNPLDETSAIQEQIPTAIPTQSAPVNEQDSRIVDIEARKIIELLKSRNIVHDITLTGNEGLIAAKSYNEKDLLKSSGFKWSTESKRWHYKFRNEPF